MTSMKMTLDSKTETTTIIRGTPTDPSMIILTINKLDSCVLTKQFWTRAVCECMYVFYLSGHFNSIAPFLLN